ncbi:SPW repeat protein [Archangium lipolyticum]|uniref:SPW repeat protein n=1 Tax=Archangium lipolyticum TaxID=2970465 RepID=UPI00214A22BC|nr:SPW repeat protein [Archangium lipolyticum]
MWARWLNVILGFWLISSPFVLGYRIQEAQLNDLCVGLGVILLELAAIAIPKLRYANTVLALWLIVSPFVLGFGGYRTATLNDVIVGLLVGALSLVWDHRVWTPHRRPLTEA